MKYYFDTKNKVVVRKYKTDTGTRVEHYVDNEWKVDRNLLAFFVAAYFGYTDDYDVDDETLIHIAEEEVEKYIVQKK
ncbi:MAG: hypothetical protein IJ999_06390 [Clostridia bacterium]|nr:hypothetical protein [Clostridia bacterium]